MVDHRSRFGITSSTTKKKRKTKKKLRRIYIVRRTVAIIILLTIIGGCAVLIFSSSQPDVTSECNPLEIEIAAEKGRLAGKDVAATAKGTMAREAAILRIRAKEREISEAGFPTAAMAFAAAAEDVMRKNDVLK